VREPPRCRCYKPRIYRDIGRSSSSCSSCANVPASYCDEYLSAYKRYETARKWEEFENSMAFMARDRMMKSNRGCRFEDE